MQLDPRFEKVTDLIRHGTFGWGDFFEPLVSSITSGTDYYLLANDFPSYIDAQASIPLQLFTQLLVTTIGWPTHSRFLAVFFTHV